MEAEQPIQRLDESQVRTKHACLEPIVDEFAKWFNTHLDKMSQTERDACQDALDNLSAGFRGLMSYSDNTLCRSCLGLGPYHGSARDLLWCHFIILRLLFVTHQKEVMAQRVDRMNPKPLAPAEIIAERFKKCPLPRLIQERYGENIDIWTEQFPPPRPRPQRWPALGQRLIALPPGINENGGKVVHKRQRDERSSSVSSEVVQSSSAEANDSDSDSDIPLRNNRRKRTRRTSVQPERKTNSSEPLASDEESDESVRSIDPSEIVKTSRTHPRRGGPISLNPNSSSRFTNNAREDGRTTEPQVPTYLQGAPSSDSPKETSQAQASVHKETHAVTAAQIPKSVEEALASDKPEETRPEETRPEQTRPEQARLEQTVPDETSRSLPKLHEEVQRMHKRESERSAREERLFQAFTGYMTLANSLPKPNDQTTALVPKVEIQGRRIETLEQELAVERERRFELEERFDTLVASLKAHLPFLDLDNARN